METNQTVKELRQLAADNRREGSLATTAALAAGIAATFFSGPAAIGVVAIGAAYGAGKLVRALRQEDKAKQIEVQLRRMGGTQTPMSPMQHA